MKKSLLLTSAAILATISVSEPAKAEGEKEKCYGVAKAGKNDCAWAGGSCSGPAKSDAEKGAWLLLPKGVCEKLAGSSLTAPSEEKKS